MTGTSKAVLAGVFLVFTIAMAVGWALLDAIIWTAEEQMNTGLQAVGLSFNLTSYMQNLAKQNPLLSFGWGLFWTLWNNIPLLLFGFLLFVLLIIAFNEQAEQSPL